MVISVSDGRGAWGTCQQDEGSEQVVNYNGRGGEQEENAGERGLSLVVCLRVRSRAGGRDAKLAPTQGLGEEGEEGREEQRGAVACCQRRPGRRSAAVTSK